MLPGVRVESDEELREYIRANACHFNGSLCGSCRMTADGEGGVLDEQLHVRGVRGLRIVDASALPSLVPTSPGSYLIDLTSPEPYHIDPVPAACL